MADIVVDGLTIDVTQEITGFSISNPRQFETTDTGIEWEGQVQLKSGAVPLGNRKIRRAIQASNVMTFVELDAEGQSVYTADYEDLTITQARIVRGNVLTTNIEAAINAASVGISSGNVTILVAAIVAAIS